jgi:hypothetical protein
VNYRIVLILLVLLTGCTNRSSNSLDSFRSIEDIGGMQIPIPSNAIQVHIDEQKDISHNKSTTMITYKTKDTISMVQAYYQDIFKEQTWDPYFVGAEMHDIAPGDLVFGNVGRDGHNSGDAVLIRNVVISIQSCGNETCVLIRDYVRHTVTEVFN